MAKKKHNAETDPGGDTAAQIDFESALAEVEQVVSSLEGGELGLSESLVQYERGIAKIKLCHQVLQRAEQRIAVLTGVDEDGTASVEPVGRGDGDQNAAPGGRYTPARKTVNKSRGPISDVDDAEGLF